MVQDISKMNAFEFCTQFATKKKEYMDLLKDIDILQQRCTVLEQSMKDVHKVLINIAMPVSDHNEIMKKMQSFCDDQIKGFRIDEKQTQLKQKRVGIDIMLELMKQMKTELKDDLSKEHNCPICFDGKVSYVIVPCGHVVCVECQQRVKESCFTCRSLVHTTIKLYLGV